ncbi:hypothetical protein Tco_0316450, partial [Tanacetum coccineum]
YIRLEEEKARRRGQVYNWETATYGKILYDEDVHYLRSFEKEFPAIIYNDALTSKPEVSSDFENEFPAIVYNDALATDHKISSEPMASPLNDNQIDFRISFDESDDEDYTVIYDKNSFSYKIIHVNDLKTDSENYNDEVDIPSNNVVVEQLDNGIDANIDTESHEFNEDFETNHDIHRKSFTIKDTIITSLKALDEGFSSNNYVRKFLRALHTKWRAKVMTIEEPKDLSLLALDELIDNIKVHEVVMEKDSKIYRGKKERVKSIALKAKSNQEKKRSHSDKEIRRKDYRKCFRCDDLNHLIGDCRKPSHKKIKRPSLEVLRAIAKMMPKTKPAMKLVSWLNRQMSCEIGLGFDDRKASTSGTKNMSFVGSFAEKATHGSTIKGTLKIVKLSLNVTFDESPPPTKLSSLVNDDVGEEEAIRKNTKLVNTNNEEDESIEVDEIINIKESKNHPLDQVIGNLNQRTLRSQA